VAQRASEREGYAHGGQTSVTPGRFFVPSAAPTASAVRVAAYLGSRREIIACRSRLGDRGAPWESGVAGDPRTRSPATSLPTPSQIEC
jgi:hypothetical protein